MGREPAGADADGALSADLARDAQHAQFVLDGQAIAGLDLDHRHAVRDQVIGSSQRAVQQIGIAGGAGGRNGGADAAARLRDFLVAGAFQPEREFAAAIAAEHQMRVAIDQRGRDECPLQLDLLPIGVILRQIACIPDPGNPPLLDCNRSVFDQTIARRPCDQRRGFAVGEDSACHTLAHLLTV